MLMCDAFAYSDFLDGIVSAQFFKQSTCQSDSVIIVPEHDDDVIGGLPLAASNSLRISQTSEADTQNENDVYYFYGNDEVNIDSRANECLDELRDTVFHSVLLEAHISSYMRATPFPILDFNPFEEALQNYRDNSADFNQVGFGSTLQTSLIVASCLIALYCLYVSYAEYRDGSKRPAIRAVELPSIHSRHGLLDDDSTHSTTSEYFDHPRSIAPPLRQSFGYSSAGNTPLPSANKQPKPAISTETPAPSTISRNPFDYASPDDFSADNPVAGEDASTSINQYSSALSQSYVEDDGDDDDDDDINADNGGMYFEARNTQAIDTPNSITI
jgi:hypothetical protein